MPHLLCSCSSLRPPAVPLWSASHVLLSLHPRAEPHLECGKRSLWTEPPSFLAPLHPQPFLLQRSVLTVPQGHLLAFSACHGLPGCRIPGQP